tara:strand:- start:79 stop:705 length:627 start_codon:yes stop_codon:yes gene_type:complete
MLRRIFEVMNKTTIALIAVILILLAALFIVYDKNETYSQSYVDSITKSRDSLAIVADQAVYRADQIAIERDKVKAQVVKTKIVYRNKTKPEKVRELEKVIGAVESDSSKVCLTYDQLDSVNYINIDKVACEALLELADKEVQELRLATANYKLGKAKGDTAIATLSDKLDRVSKDLEKAKKRIKRNRKIALWAALVAVVEGAFIIVRK